MRKFRKLLPCGDWIAVSAYDQYYIQIEKKYKGARLEDN